MHHARALATSVCSILCTVILVKKLERGSPSCILAALDHWQCRDELFILSHAL